MVDILHDIIAHKHQELAQWKSPKPSMRQALACSPTGIIAEFKRRSPSKGWINKQASPDEVPLSYQTNGAAAISILTDEQYFGGCDRYIVEARQSGVTIPVLYKNFIIDEYQLYQACLCGASAVLLIAACLPLDTCRTLLVKAHTLGLEVLLEMHSAEELRYADLRPDMCGINNRHLGSFVTDVDVSFQLAEQLKAACGDDESAPLLVSESGIGDAHTICELRQAGFRGFLIGETFMRTPAPGLALRNLIEQIRKEMTPSQE